jgi:hypothetical protein
MPHTINALVNRLITIAIGALIGLAGFFASSYVNRLNESVQFTIVQIAQIQKDIKQIEVTLASLNARLLTTEQVRLIAAEVAEGKINQAILTHVRNAHESK